MSCLVSEEMTILEASGVNWRWQEWQRTRCLPLWILPYSTTSTEWHCSLCPVGKDKKPWVRFTGEGKWMNLRITSGALPSLKPLPLP